jgi:hypothetical protein
MLLIKTKKLKNRPSYLILFVTSIKRRKSCGSAVVTVYVVVGAVGAGAGVGVQGEAQQLTSGARTGAGTEHWIPPSTVHLINNKP